MLRSIRHTVVFLSLLGAVVLRCGSLSSPTMAGGSGAGNPGTGSVAVSISVRFVPILMKSAALTGLSYADSSADTTQSMTTTDKGGTAVTVTSITLNYFDLHFTLDSTQRPSDLLSRVRPDHNHLQADSNSIFVNWPHPFNALHADTVKGDSSIELPIAPYTGMTLFFRQLSLGWQSFDRDTMENSLLIRGYFTYRKQVHSLTVRVAYTMCPYAQNYRFAGGMFTLSSSDTTHIELQFDAAKWFSHIDLKDALDDNQLWFDYNRGLTIDNQSPFPPFSWIGGSIAADFLKSGKLVVY